MVELSFVWGVAANFLLFATAASAQSTASFPEPASAAPKPRTAPTPPAPAAVPQPAASAAPKPAASIPAPAQHPAPAVSAAPAAPIDAKPATPAAAPSLPLPPNGEYSLSPALLPYRAGLPVPPGYKVERRSANGLIIGGVASLLVGYVTAIAVGGGDDFKNGTGWVVLPVVGPWAAIGARSYHCDNSALDVLQAQKAANQCVRGAFNEVQTIAILSADAVVQATGAVLFLAGLASGEDQLVRTDLAGLQLTPRQVGRDGFGIGFDGRF